MFLGGSSAILPVGRKARLKGEPDETLFDQTPQRVGERR